MDQSLVTAAVLFILGILLGHRLTPMPAALWAASAVMTVLSIVAYRADRRRVAKAMLTGLIVVAGAIRCQLAAPEFDPTHYVTRSAFFEGRFKARLTDDPASLADRGRATVQLVAVRQDDRWVQLSGGARLVIPHGLDRGPMLSYGDVVSVDGTLKPPSTEFVGPGTRVCELWAAEGIHGTLQTRRPIELVDRAGRTVHGTLYDFRRSLSEVLDRTHPPEVASFVRAILLGIRDLPSDQLSDFRATGTYHLLSLSGCHVGILAMVLLALASALRVPRRWGGAFTILVLFTYALMTGGSSSVLRATLMAGIFIAGKMIYRPLSIYTALALSALVLLMANPLELYLPGFQLSFLAVLSIAYLTPPIMTRLDFLPPYLNALISTSLGATLGTAPVLALSFGELSLISPLANLLVIPLFGIILPVALLGIAGCAISPWIPFFFGAANYGFVTLLSRLVHQMAQFPWAAIDVSHVTPTVWVLYSLVLVVLGDWRNLREVVARRSSGDARPEENPAVEEIDKEALARTAKELACLLPEDVDADDPIASRLAAVRGVIRAQTHELAPEFLMRCEALVSEPWAGALDPLTIAYLGLSDTYLACRSADKAPSLLLLIKALEHELNVHLFGALRRIPGLSRASALQGRYPRHPLILFLSSPPKTLSLEQQNELLWAVVTHQDRPLKALARAISRGLAESVRDVGFFLDPSRLPLRLDQVYKRFYSRLDKESWGWEGVRRARDEILGPKQENLFAQIGQALATRDAEAPADASPASASLSPDDDSDDQPLERLAWDQRSEAR